jgi:hypothetical protein
MRPAPTAGPINGTRRERTTAARHAPGDQRPLTEAEAIVADRLAMAELEASGDVDEFGPPDDRAEGWA